MNKIMGWILAISCGIIAICNIVFVFSKASAIQLSENIIIAIIGVAGLMFTALGSILLAKYTTNSEVKMRNREIKQRYYDEFAEAFIKKNILIRNINHPESKSINEKFFLEVHKLPLYASPEMIDLVERMKSGEVPSFGTIYSIMRDDLISDRLVPLKNQAIMFSVPQEEQ